MRIIDGNTISEEILNELKAKVKSFTDTRPSVLFIRVGEDQHPYPMFEKNRKLQKRSVSLVDYWFFPTQFHKVT